MGDTGTATATPADGATGAGGEALRRVDWRFLLDRPALGRVLLDGPADATLRAGLAAVSSEVSALERAPAGEGSDRFEVAVLVAPSAGRIAAVARRCPPGAWLVAELAPPWRRLPALRGPRRSGPGAASKALRRAGLEVDVRWAWPSFATALELVPLHDTAALELSLRRRRSRRARLAIVAVRTAARLGRLAALVPSVVVVAHRPAEDTHADGPSGFLAAAIAARGGGGDRTPATGAPLVLTPRFPASRHVIALGLDGAGRPAVVAKVPRRREDDDGLRREADALERIARSADDGHPTLSGSEARTVTPAPRSLGLAQLRGWPVLLETALAGTTLGRPAIRADRDRWVAAAADLAARLAIAGEPADPDDRLGRLVEAPLGRLVDALPPGDPLAARARRTIELLAPLARSDLPPVLEHGDLAPPNLLVGAEGDLTAIDWELAEPTGLPGHDLSLFLHFAAVAVAGPGTERDPDATGAAVAAAFSGPSPWAAEALRRHLATIGADPDLALPLAVAAFARVACSMPARAGQRAGPWLARDRHAVAWEHLLRWVA